MDVAKRKVMTGARFLSFVLDNETYCLDIKKVKELIGFSQITHIPQAPPFIKGVINLRGQIIPIIDLRVKFGLSEREYNKRTGIIVVELVYENDIIYIGIIVDTITEVLGMEEDAIKKIPYLNAKIKSEFIKGIANLNGKINIVIDIDKILSEEEFVILKDVESVSG